jgi:CRISPR type I-E-associated protein CasA/Cse1
MTFNLVEEPWLPVYDRAGEVRDVSLGSVFENGSAFRDLAIGFAPERVAVTRVLVAVLQSALRGPAGGSERLRWLQDPGPTQAQVTTYLDGWRERFDLFHPVWPFMQKPIGDDASDKSIAMLKLEWASGNNVTLFDHHRDDRRPELTPAEATRALLATLLYQPAGGVSKPFNRTDSPGTKPIMVLVQGANLWETLVGNCSEYVAREGDAPIWERDGDHEPDSSGTVPYGLLDRLTWRSRAVLILRDPDGAVRRCRLHQHLKLLDDPPSDPFVPVRQTNEGPKIVRPPASRRLWRAANAVLHGLSDEGHPNAIKQALKTFESLDPPHHPQMLAVGLWIEQGKVADVQSALLPVSSRLLEDPELLDRVTWAIEQAEIGDKAIWSAIGKLNEVMGAEMKTRTAERWQSPYWAAVGGDFASYLHDLSHASETPTNSSPVSQRWVTTLRRHAWTAFDAIDSQDAPDPRQARALALAADLFRAKLGGLAPVTNEAA